MHDSQLLTDSDNKVVYYVVAAGKRFGPYPNEAIAGVQLATNLPLTESEKMSAQIIPSTQDGKQILLES